MLNASRRFRKGRPKNYLPAEDIKSLAAAYLKGEPVDGELNVIDQRQAAAAEYNLSPSRWGAQHNGAETASIPGLLDKLERINANDVTLTSELRQLLRPLASAAELFTRGLRGEAQKETEIGAIPASWNLVELRDVREWLQYGTSTHCTAEKRGYPVLRIPNIGSGQIDPTDLKYCDLKTEEAKKYLLEAGDLLFIRTNGVLDRLGACAVYQGNPADALFASYLIRARIKTGVVDPRYIAYFYGSRLGTSLVASRATPAADGKYNLNTGTIDALPLPLPPTLQEQVEIVNVLDAIGHQMRVLDEKRSMLDELFQSLLHGLMAGDIRVDQLDRSVLGAGTAAKTTKG